jgi:hypothetical protein
VTGTRAGAGLRRTAVLLGTCLAVLLGSALPAAADPAGPTHYRSTVTAVEADGGAVPFELEVLGGDAFLVVRVEPGHEVEVPGYEGEPYVRIGPDGTVEVNQRSPSRWINEDRYETQPEGVPPDVGVDAPPRWEAVADGGEYAWHDHRIHWMSPSLPRQVDPSARAAQPVFDWDLPVLVDGAEATVTGELVWWPGPAPAITVALVVLAVAGGVALAWWRPRWVPLGVVVSAVVTLGVGLAKNAGLPPGADGEPFLVVLPLLTLGLVVAGVVVAGRDRAGSRDGAVVGRVGGVPRGRLIVAAAGLPLVVWGVVQAGALTRPLVPGPLPTGVVRAVVVGALAVGLAGFVTAARALVTATALAPSADAPEPDATAPEEEPHGIGQ